MKINTLKECYVHEINNLYDAEKKLMDALPKMVEKAHAKELQDVLRSEVDEIKGQITRLEEIFRRHNVQAERGTSEGTRGLLDESEEICKSDASPEVRDAALISSLQRVKHYEIAAYGSARSFAKALGLDQDVSQLEESLEQEKNADRKLTKLAEEAINPRAVKAA